ncbi:hypothetical protein VB712_11310 [Spirulina sp. CCNP1310]|uniref:hypothetical protein n=1 Tax=Spirulina sp. CCNP1310 TaxID=3110249 RepID=UPI002B21DA9E|nr:hypothetical protein [Spirulina sp. CCNP1310]MEA5419813.1 hypothetical protein [Spirulina sp. CCNP1310]
MQKLQNSVRSEGWSIQVYSGDRRLILSLDASHAWLLGTGIGIGFGIALLGLRGQCQAAQPPSPGESAPLVAPFQVD